MSRSFWITAFLLLIGLGLGFGILRDTTSKEQGLLDATVAGNTSASGYRWPTSPPSIKVRLNNGEIVDVATRGGTEPSVGHAVQIRAMLTPWGQVWYKLKD